MKTVMLACLLLLLSLPTFAQNTTEESPSECKAAAQTWYDAISTDGIINLSITLAESPQADTNIITGAFLAIDQSLKKTAALAYPNCVERARQWYLDGAQLVERGYFAMIVQRDVASTAGNIAIGSQQIGEFRGYLAALGVTLVNPPNTTLFLK